MESGKYELYSEMEKRGVWDTYTKCTRRKKSKNNVGKKEKTKDLHQNASGSTGNIRGAYIWGKGRGRGETPH